VLPDKKYSISEAVQILKRGKWLIVLPCAIGLVAGVMVSSRLAKLYRSETLIMVVPQGIPSSYVTPTVTATVEDRLPTISDQILSRSRLERIIFDFDLYQRERAQQPMEDVVQRMRGDIEVLLEKNQASFRVSYLSHSPTVAQKVTERLASLYIDENMRDREKMADSTNKFLESQLEDAKRRLLEHERKLEEYRKRFSGQLPSQLEGNLRAIQNAQLRLQTLSESMNRARERRNLVERELADLQVVQVAPVPTAPPGSPEAAVPLSASQELDVAQKRLEAYRLRYTADHPDIRSLERVIAELKVKAAEERAAQANAASQAEEAVALLTPQEALRQKRIRDLQADLVTIDRQLAANEAEESRVQAAITEYQGKVDVVPTRESELVELTRDYGTLQATYSGLLTKYEDSKLAANLERRQIGEQFKVLDAASLPERPANQNVRLGVVAGAALGGLVLGLLIVGLLEFRDSSFKREEEVVRVLTLPVLAVVPLMASDQERRSRWRRKLALNLAGVAVLVGCAAVLVYWRL
jgi:polysaccharide chain length determinant protein (PEP-CTERM system associated)